MTPQYACPSTVQSGSYACVVDTDHWTWSGLYVPHRPGHAACRSDLASVYSISAGSSVARGSVALMATSFTITRRCGGRIDVALATVCTVVYLPSAAYARTTRYMRLPTLSNCDMSTLCNVRCRMIGFAAASSSPVPTGNICHPRSMPLPLSDVERVHSYATIGTPPCVKAPQPSETDVVPSCGVG